MAFSADGQLLASGSDDQTVRLWEVHIDHCIGVFREHDKGIWSVAFSADGQLLASGSDDQTVRLWDAHTGQCLKTLEGHTNQVWSVSSLIFKVSRTCFRVRRLPPSMSRKPPGRRYASILHLSCHARLDPDSPLDSAFLLAQETELTLRDLLEANEQPLALLQLALLSACQTAVMEQNLSNEVIGLFTGFLHTGVPCVIGTLWPVEDVSTALLMIRFYDLYLYGDAQLELPPQSPAAALRRAQGWLRDLTYSALRDYVDEQARQIKDQLQMHFF